MDITIEGFHYDNNELYKKSIDLRERIFVTELGYSKFLIKLIVIVMKTLNCNVHIKNENTKMIIFFSEHQFPNNKMRNKKTFRSENI